jgi:two-component system, cell cycle response regulator DivK
VSKTVLVVEDHADNLLIVATILRHYGYDVLTAEDGEVAISVASRELPDLVLLDISIPKIDGWDVARTLKRETSTADIPLIAFTAHVYDADRARATDEGFVGFLTKPVEPTRIVQEISRFIGAP